MDINTGVRQDEIADVNIEIGLKIRKLRKGKGLTTTDLGRYLGVSQQQVSRYERGVSVVCLPVLEKLSFLFHVSINQLLITDKK